MGKDAANAANAARAANSWDSAAAGWGKWWETFEKSAKHVSDRLVELAGVQPGHSVLDIATGIGEPAVTAAKLVGPSGKVTAIDSSRGMLSIARQRTGGLGLGNISFIEMDAGRLDFPRQGFQAAICRWGLMFLPDLDAALGRVHDILAPGGRFSAAVWDAPAKVPLISLGMNVAQRILKPPAPPPGTSSVFGLAAPGLLEQAFIKNGFKEVHAEGITVRFAFDSAASFTNYMKDVAAPINAMLDGKPEELNKEVWQAITDAASAYCAADGGIVMSNEAICVAGRR